MRSPTYSKLIFDYPEKCTIDNKENAMGKEKHGTKEGKKQAVLTQKEKKVAKQVKKQEKAAPHPLIPR